MAIHEKAPTDDQEDDGLAALIPSEGKPGQVAVDLSDAGKKALRKICRDLSKRDSVARKHETMLARQGRLYYRGDQNIAWNADADHWDDIHRSSDKEDDGDSRHVYNLYLATARSIISALSQAAPGCVFEPQDPDAPTDNDGAQAANAIKSYIESENEITDLLAEIARLFFTDGRVAVFSRYVEDGQEFGFTLDDAGKRTPNSGEKIEAFGVLEVSVPIHARKQKAYSWLALDYEIDLSFAKAMFPDVADELSATGSSADSDGGGSWERMARLSVQGGTGGSDTDSQDLVTYSRRWLRPSAFAAAPEADRGELIAAFPDGACVTHIGDTYCEAVNESLDAHWTILLPMPADGQSAQSLGNPVVPLNQVFNGLQNQRNDNHLYGGAITWVDPKRVDIDAVNEQRSKPGNHLPINRDDEAPISENFYEQPPATLSPDLVAFAGEIAGPLLAQISAVSPSLNGLGDKHNETAQGQAEARESALGQLGLCWRAIKKGYAQIMGQAVRCASNRSQDIKFTPAGSKTAITVCIEDLRAGNYRARPDTDDSHPMSWSQKKAALTGLMHTDNPSIAAVLTDPANAPLVASLLGFPELHIAGKDESLKQTRELAELLKSEPVPNVPAIQQRVQAFIVGAQQASAAGQPPPPKPTIDDLYEPSVPVDIDWDDHAVELGVCKSWINSPAGQTAKVKNPSGFENVKLHGNAHRQALQEQQKQAAMAAAPPPPPVAPPKGPSLSINYKDVAATNPAAGNAILAEAGLPAAPPPVAPQPAPLLQ